MDIEKMFDFLVKDYRLNYKFQKFNNCFNGNWYVETFSYYNASGCFTIHNLCQRGEIDCYYAKSISCIRENLLEKRLNVRSIGIDIWNKESKRFRFDYRQKLIMDTLVKAIKYEINKKHEFFGIRID